MDDHGLCYEAACEVQLSMAATGGDQHAFVELCRRYSPSLKRRIQRIVQNHEDVEDVLQDTLINAFRHLGCFRAESSFRTWITTIAINKSLMLLRRRRNHPETGLGLVTTNGKDFETWDVRDPMPNPEQLYAKRQAGHLVAQAVNMLPTDYRLLVESYHQNEVRLADVANAIGITPAAAKSRLLRARRLLRRRLKDHKLR
jgi:RNA polymerase sigma-70 factor, ECF subfamily